MESKQIGAYVSCDSVSADGGNDSFHYAFLVNEIQFPGNL
jgi:hypothetical protein